MTKVQDGLDTSQNPRHWGLKVSTWQHLRFPFSLFLTPVFLFAWSQTPEAKLNSVLFTFVLLHFGLYPASNGYNSYYDQDQGPIGGVEKPIPPERELLWVANALDGITVLGLFALDFRAGCFAILYSVASRAYSHPFTRWKGRPFLGLFTVILCQGALIYYLCILAWTPSAGGLGYEVLFDPRVLLPALASSLLLAGSYPLTQIYQHPEDAQRGDLTLSRLLGVRGTFLFSGVVTLLSAPALLWTLTNTNASFSLSTGITIIAFLVCTSPAGAHLARWAFQSWSSPTPPTHQDAMKMNRLGALGIALFFILRVLAPYSPDFVLRTITLGAEVETEVESD